MMIELASNPAWHSTFKVLYPAGAQVWQHWRGPPGHTKQSDAIYCTGSYRKKREKISVYGNDYKTPDGTGYRDYVHG